MHGTWTHTRRWVASLMLVAFASFVLHGSAMARLTPMHAATSMAGHDDRDSHDHGNAVTHVHSASLDAAAQHGGPGDGADHHGTQGACCGSYCTTAIAPFARDAAISRVVTAAAVPTFEAAGHGIDDESPRKPPRTPDIA